MLEFDARISRGEAVPPLDMVDNSLGPLRTYVGLGFSSFGAPERVLHSVVVA